MSHEALDVPNTIPGTGDTKAHQADQIPSPQRPFIPVEETEGTSERKYSLS